ncbi:hypothetical protein EMCRGX_G020657 [Ephydatia muelleri]
MMSRGIKDVNYQGGEKANGTVVVAPESRILHYWRARAWSRVGVVVVIVILIIVVSAVVSTRYDGNVHMSATSLSPGDTRLVSPSSTLCESTTLNNPTSTVSATVFLLHRKPILGARDNFTLTDTFHLAYKEYRYWSFYMYPGSGYALSSCLTYGSVAYYVIKGEGNFVSWINARYTSEYSALHYSDHCGTTNRTTDQIVTSEDQYYFVFYNTFYMASNVHAMLTINSVGYLPHSGGVVDSCTAPPTSSCSLIIPHDSEYTVLVETSPPTNGRWDTSVNVGIAAITAGIVIAVCCCVKMRPLEKDGASTVISVQTLSTAPISSDVLTVQPNVINEKTILPSAGQQAPPTIEQNIPQQFALSTWTADKPPPSYSAAIDP